MRPLRFRVCIHPDEGALFSEVSATAPEHRGARLIALATLGLAGAKARPTVGDSVSGSLRLRITVTPGCRELFDDLAGTVPRRRPARLLTWAAAAMGAPAPASAPAPSEPANEPDQGASVWAPGPITF